MKTITDTYGFVRFLLVAGCMLLAIQGGYAQQPTPSELFEQAEEVGIERAQLEAIHQRAQQAGISNEAFAQIVKPAVDLGQQDLPAQAVLRKVQEGLAKGVPAARIAPVVSGISDQTQQAASMVGQWLERPETRGMLGGREAELPPEARNEMITSIVEVRQQDVSSDAIRALLQDLPSLVSGSVTPAQVNAGVQVLGNLPEPARNSSSVRSLVASALQAGFSPGEISQLSQALPAAAEAGNVPVERLAGQTARQIRQGQPPGEVITGLFQGGTPGPPEGTPGGAPEDLPPGQKTPPGVGGQTGNGDGRPDGPPGDGDDGKRPPDGPPGRS